MQVFRPLCHVTRSIVSERWGKLLFPGCVPTLTAGAEECEQMRVGISTFLVIVLICLLAIVSPLMLGLVFALFGALTLVVARVRDDAYRPSCTQCRWRGRPCATRRAAEMLALAHVCDSPTPFGSIPDPVLPRSDIPPRRRRASFPPSQRRPA